MADVGALNPPVSHWSDRTILGNDSLPIAAFDGFWTEGMTTVTVHQEPSAAINDYGYVLYGKTKSGTWLELPDTDTGAFGHNNPTSKRFVIDENFDRIFVFNKYIVIGAGLAFINQEITLT